MVPYILLSIKLTYFSEWLRVVEAFIDVTLFLIVTSVYYWLFTYYDLSIVYKCLFPRIVSMKPLISLSSNMHR